jgi:hypothetical protein
MSKGSKSRKDQFEDQLRDLQKDITNLTHKLSVPSSSALHQSQNGIYT